MIDISETYARSSTQNNQWQRTYKRTFQIITDNKDIGAKAIRQALPVEIGQTYASRSGTDFDTGSFCNSITVDCRDEDGKGWTATADYGPYDATTAPQSPIERPIKVSWGFISREKVLDVDADAKLVRNSAGDPFDPPAVVDEFYPVLTIQRCEMTNDPALNFLYRSAVNSDPFLGADPGTVRCFPIEAEQSKDQDIGWFWTKNYRFEYDPEGWNKPTADLGLRKNVSGVISNILSKGKEVTEPVLLNGTGGENPIGADPIFLPFKRYKILPFDVFNFTLDMFPHN
jgi:hypothetical protein